MFSYNKTTMLQILQYGASHCMDRLMFCSNYSFIGPDLGGLLLPVSYVQFATTEQDVIPGIVIQNVAPFFNPDHF